MSAEDDARKAEQVLQEVLKAAEQGDAYAQFLLIQMGADMGDAKSQYELAMIYGKGLGVPRDIEKAKELMYKAAEQGHKGAKDFLAHVATLS